MRLSLLLTILVNFSVSAAVYSQAKKFDIVKEKVTVREVFDQIMKESDYKFFYNNEFDITRRVSVDLHEATIDQVMSVVLQGQPYSLSMVDNYVIIRRNEGQAPEKSVQAPRRTITGTVTDVGGKPMVGASIYLKGRPDQGTTTDTNGRYTLTFEGNNVVIVFSYIGMTSQEVTVGTASRYNIVMLEDVSKIQTVNVTVKTGLQEIPTERMAGSHVTITAKDLENSQFMSIDQALQGKVAGLYSVTTSGQPGVRSEIRIRGDNTISGNKEPLWVIDGLPEQSGVYSIQNISLGNIQQSILDHGIGNIMPSDIESITVLKDAAATAIYGSRAANGVIVVQTKRGGQGPLTVSYQGNLAIGGRRGVNLDFMNSSEKVDYEIDIIERFGETSSMGRAATMWDQWKRGNVSEAYYNNYINELKSTNTNWFDEIFRSTFSHNHNISIRGGSEKMWTATSLAFSDQQGTLKANKYQRMAASLTIGYKPVKDFEVSIKLDGNVRDSRNHASVVNPFHYALFANPYEKPYNEDGSYAVDKTWLYPWKSYYELQDRYADFNIMRELDRTRKKDVGSDLTATMHINWQIIPDLKAELIGRLTYSSLNTETTADRGTYTSYENYFNTLFSAIADRVPEEFNMGYYRETSGRSNAYAFTARLTYTKDIAFDHHIQAFAGAEISNKENWNSFFKAAQYDMEYMMTGFPTYTWQPELNAALTTSLGAMNGIGYDIDRSANFYGSLIYSYKDRYVMNANIRLDGAGTINAENRFTPLFSVGLRWNIHNESFIRNHAKFISQLSVRGSFGYTGSIDRNALPYPYVTTSSRLYDQEYIAQGIYFPNPSIRWEKKRERNIGVDFAFFDNVFGGVFEYYNNKTEDLLDRTSVPNSFGTTAITLNSGSIKNEGIELGLNFRVPIGPHFRFIGAFNIAKNFNKITKSYYKTIEELKETKSQLYAGVTGNVQGYKPGAIFGLRFAGVDPKTGKADIWLSQEAREYWADYKKIPRNEDGSYDLSTVPEKMSLENWGFAGLTQWEVLANKSLDMLGYTQPSYTGGFTTRFQWKGLELSSHFTFATGHILETYNEKRNSPRPADSGSQVNNARTNRPRYVLNSWKSPGDITDIPRHTSINSYYERVITSDEYAKADYLSISDISLNYTLPASLLRNIALKYVSVGFQVQNPHVFTKFPGLDVTTGGALSYPIQRKYLLNVKLTF